MRKLPHLTKNRYGVYYFRLIFTQSVRALPNAPQEISLSLETKDSAIARERYMLLYPCARAFRWSIHTQLMKGDIDVNTARKIVSHWKEKNQLRELLAASKHAQSRLQRELMHARNNNQELQKHNQTLYAQTQKLTGAYNAMKTLVNTQSSNDDVPRETKDSVSKNERGSLASTDAAQSSSRRQSADSTQITMDAKPRTRMRTSRSETLFAYVEKFLTHEDTHSTHGKHTKEARRNNLMRFLDIVGYGLALKSLSANHIRHYRDMMHAIPSNFEKKGFEIPKSRAARPKWFKRTIADWTGATLSGSGIDTHFKHVRVFLTWAQNEHYLKHDFVSMLKVSKKRAKETKKEVVNFMPDDLSKLFISGYLYGDKKAARDNNVAWQFWIPLIALYTGMRSEEIGSLRLNSIVKIEGYWCIQIDKSKTEAGERIFPIPQRLLDAGLLDYRLLLLETLDSDMNASLFPTLKMKGGEYSNRIGQFFNRNINGRLNDGSIRMEGYMFKCGVENPSETQTLKFHSFRHGFITKWLEARLPLDTLKNIVGHRGDFKTYGVVYEEKEGATETYIHIDRMSGDARQRRLSTMKQGMDAMNFGVDLSGISYQRFLARK